MFDYKKKLQKSPNENRKGFAISKLHTLFTGGKKLWYKSEAKKIIVLLYYFMLLSKPIVNPLMPGGNKKVTHT